MNPLSSLSVVLPARDERDSLPELFNSLLTLLPSIAARWEIILMDDASADGTFEWARSAMEQEGDRFRCVRMERPSGQSAALWAGFRAARFDWIATLDADGQMDPGSLASLVRMSDGTDAVIGVRTNRRDAWSRRAGAWIARRIGNFVLKRCDADPGCPLRLMRRRAVERLPYFDGAHRFFPALLERSGSRLRRVPVPHYPRRHGRSHYSNRARALKAWRDLWRVRAMPAVYASPD